MIFLEERHLKIIKDILNRYSFAFYAFGSRVKGDHKNLSDLDLYFTENIPSSLLSAIKEDFEESDLPFKVDIIDYNSMDEEFRKRIRPDSIIFHANASKL